MTFAASLLLLFGLLVGAVGAIWLSIAVGPRTAAVVTTLTLGAAIVGFDVCSQPIVGRLTQKTEKLEVAAHGINPSVSRQFNLSIAVTPTVMVRLDTSERYFDTLREGDRMVLRGVRFGSAIFARPEATSWWKAALDSLAPRLPIPRSTPPIAASAEVISVHTIRDAYTRSWFAGSTNGDTHVVLKQPYDEIKFRFVSQAGIPIVTLDRVDAGSAGTMKAGSSVRIVYYRDRPRSAVIAVGLRSFNWRNTLNYWCGLILVGAMLLALVATGSAAWRALMQRYDRIRSARRP